ncbi:arylsulfatase K isoform X3 [Gopherus evgoodei]|uniref:arylsulfatase K isoform X3 n=1 Tax=Gopherus evgoodei TaxID=1825980 RepID=UPI0011D00DE8|nr:arylsulfatase K isoform X3 [Gopherus evgoodei]
MRGLCREGPWMVVLAALVLLLVSTLWEGSKARPVAWGHLGAGRSQRARNVVMVMCDAFDGRLTFYPGNQTVILPFINLMKRYGTVFLSAYTNSPICCPSRAAMWSGLFTHLTESWNNFKGLDPNYTTWMDLMQKHGYRTQKYGKLDYTSGHHSVSFYLWSTICQQRSNRVEAWTRDVDFLLRQEGRPMVNLTGNKTFVRVMEEDWQNTDKAASWIRKEATNFSQPFVLYLGLNLPHPYPSPSTGENFGSSTFLTSPYWLEKVTYEAIKIPKWPPLSDMHPVDYYSSYTKNCTGKFTRKEIRDIRAFYYAMCAETDAMLGEIISALSDTGLLKRTIVIFTADHGELAMEHQQFYKMSMYEASSHVPLLVMGPNIKAHHHLSNVVSLVDIYPTMLDIARIPIPQNLSGYSLIPLLAEMAEDEVSSRRLHPTWILSEFHGCNANSSTYMLRTDKWKYIAYSDGHSVPPQLFDLSADPDELTNIATTFPEVTYSLDKKLCSIVNYPRISASVHKYNKKQFINWKQSLGQNYSNVIANLRWHQDWLKEPRKYKDAIHRWLQMNTNE